MTTINSIQVFNIFLKPLDRSDRNQFLVQKSGETKAKYDDMTNSKSEQNVLGLSQQLLCIWIRD